MKLQEYLNEIGMNKKPVPKIKWKKEWWKNAVDAKNKKMYSFTSEDGRYTIAPTGKHPTKGFAHKEKRNFWGIYDNKLKHELPITFTSNAKAKVYVENIYNDRINEGILDDVLNMGSKYLYFWKNTWIINTFHGFKRIVERNKLSSDDIKRLFQEAIEKTLQIGVEVGEEILFWSKSLKQGFVSAIDPQGNITLITFLPKGKHHPLSGTEHIVIEGTEKQIRVIRID